MTDAPTTRETADHAELADLCERLRSGRMTDGTRIRTAMKIETLLSEIAALQRERDRAKERMHAAIDKARDEEVAAQNAELRATQAERQRDEAKAVIEEFLYARTDKAEAMARAWIANQGAE